MSLFFLSVLCEIDPKKKKKEKEKEKEKNQKTRQALSTSTWLAVITLMFAEPH